MAHSLEKFSATYGGTRENFIIKNSSARADVSSEVLKIFCVVKNILLRGEVTKNCLRNIWANIRL